MCLWECMGWSMVFVGVERLLSSVCRSGQECLVKSWSNVSAGVEGCRVFVVVGELAKSVCKSRSLVKSVSRSGGFGQECLQERMVGQVHL